MSLRSLSLLVLTLVVGTAASVRWYLDADALDRQALEHQAVEHIVPAPRAQHVPLPMRAEPARGPANRESSRSLSGVALRGQDLSWHEVELRVELRPTTVSDDDASGPLLPLQAGAPH